MAELNIGNHCNVSDCKQLDFLPLQCNLCKKMYCKEHASYDAHTCVELGMLMADKSASNDATLQQFKCEFSGCNSRELVEVRCTLCGANYCFVHRHAADHSCPSMALRSDYLPKTTQLVQSILSTQPKHNSSANRVFKNPKSAATALKIALIKLKQTAVGDAAIPEADRVFFNVALPLDSRQKYHVMFFNRAWYVGKAIDKVASSVGLMNVNNQSGSARNLHMFDGTTGVLCPSGRTLADLTDSSKADGHIMVHNGSTVILEYTDDTVQQITVENYNLRH